GFDLGAVAYDAFIAHQLLHTSGIHPRHSLDVKGVKRAPEILALAQNCEPAQTGHESLEAELLEETPIVRNGAAPLAIVIALIQVIAQAPPAARNAIRASGHAAL